MLGKLGSAHNRSEAVSNGCRVLAPIACQVISQEKIKSVGTSAAGAA